MNAHQQLSDAINARGFDAPIIALLVIRDHGPAIAQLLHSVRELLDEPCSMTFSVTAAALRKLTQDA